MQFFEILYIANFTRLRYVCTLSRTNLLLKAEQVSYTLSLHYAMILVNSSYDVIKILNINQTFCAYIQDYICQAWGPIHTLKSILMQILQKYEIQDTIHFKYKYKVFKNFLEILCSNSLDMYMQCITQFFACYCLSDGYTYVAST